MKILTELTEVQAEELIENGLADFNKLGEPKMFLAIKDEKRTSYFHMTHLGKYCIIPDDGKNRQ